jgi:hypothetical protein
LVSSIPTNEKLFIGDLNGHVGTFNTGFEGQEDKDILDFAVA